MATDRKIKSAALLSDVKSLGFTEYEAKAYLALIESSPATAYDISNRSGVPRPNTYSALKALAARGAVMPISENPSRYVPQPPDQLFSAIASQTRQLCDTISERLSDIAETPGEQYVWNLRGETEVHGKVADMIAGAERAIWFKGEPSTLRVHAKRLRAAAVDRGVRLMVILYGQDTEEFRYTSACEVYIHEATGVPMGFADNLFTVAVDHREMLTANLEETMVAAHAENRAVVKMALSLLRHDYYMAEIFRVFKDEIDAEFGEHLRDLRKRTHTPEQYEALRQKTGI
ncbi:MAG: helix-turn-helix domain-containing protein [Pseudomonadota bacterium]